jgi:hypothetical protein
MNHFSFTIKSKIIGRLWEWLFILVLGISSVKAQETITFGTLVDEMTNLNRLTLLPDQSYRTIQFSSYDRRSQTPGMRGWFYNSDGFGGEPIPGFEEVIEHPDTSGVGTYLICDIDGPGTILRLWTAGLNGRIRLYLDKQYEPLYDGNAEEFFWNTASGISGINNELTSQKLYRQFDATYFPIPFSKGCRIEWIGDIKKIHFYHVGVRLYDDEVKVKSFQTKDISDYANNLKKLRDIFHNYGNYHKPAPAMADTINSTIPENTSAELLHSEGPGAIDHFSIKVNAKDLETALRSNILSIYFDDADIPQVHVPLGDFFGAAPGLNPYISYPFSIYPDGSMICRFIMPFKNSVRMEIENLSEGAVSISGGVHYKDYIWIEGKSMHFRARWKMNHGLTASNSSVLDIPYILANGRGRIVGAAAFLYNPSDAVMSWGNWWGEGDEKIFIDDEEFPSFFGTGSEDYFNYSWSAEHFFSFPYCGQPRNDGPGNRGYVSNFRWHISDDITFNKNLAFYMELRHHGVVSNFSYGRIIYAYTLPGCIDDYMPIPKFDVNRIPYLEWSPLAYLGSSGYIFIQSEDIVSDPSSIELSDGRFWSEEKILLWKPGKNHEKLRFITTKPEEGAFNLGITIAHMPQGGAFKVLLNDNPVLFNGEAVINSKDSLRTYLRNHISAPVPFQSGGNEIVLEYIEGNAGNEIGIDFFWIKDK